MPATHLDTNSTGVLTTSQTTKLKNALRKLATDSEFNGVCFYIDLGYIGGRADDRS